MTPPPSHAAPAASERLPKLSECGSAEHAGAREKSSGDGQLSEFSQTQTGSPGTLLPRAGRVPGSSGPVAAVRSSTHASLPSSRTLSAQPKSGAQTARVAGCADFSEPWAVRPSGHKCVPAVTEAEPLGSQSLPKPKAQRTGGGRRSSPAAARGPLRAREPPTGGKEEAG